MIIEGIVDSVYTKQVNTKRGLGTVYHAMVNGQDINLGFKKMVEEGEHVALNCEQKYGTLQVVSMAPKGSGTPVPTGAPSAKPAPASGGGGWNKGTFPLKSTDHAVSICRQNALTNANATVSSYVAVLCSKAKATTEMPDLDLLSDMVLSLAMKYAAFSTGEIDTILKGATTGE